MSPTDPREPEPPVAEPGDGPHDPGMHRWNTVPGEVEDASNPGPRRAALGVVLAVVALAVGLLAWLADFALLVWLAVAALAVSLVLIALGYREWREDAER